MRINKQLIEIMPENREVLSKVWRAMGVAIHEH